MARVLSFPFRLAANGSVVTVEQDTEQANAEELGTLLGTLLGERPLVPDYGVDDSTFGELDEGAVVAAVELFGPPVTIESVETTYGETTADVLVTFR
jgi:hypothetical protein